MTAPNSSSQGRPRCTSPHLRPPPPALIVREELGHIPQITSDYGQFAPSAPRWCFGSSGLTTNPNTCRTQLGLSPRSPTLHPIHGVSFNSKGSYSGYSPSQHDWNTLGTCQRFDAADRASHSHDLGASSQRASVFSRSPSFSPSPPTA